MGKEIDRICRGILKMPKGSKPAAVTVLFGVAGFGKTTLALQLADRCAELNKGRAIFFALDEPRSVLRSRCRELALSNIVISDENEHELEFVLEKIAAVDDARIVVVDEWTLMSEEQKSWLARLIPSTRLPILVTRTLSRAAVYSPDGNTAFEDIKRSILFDMSYPSVLAIEHRKLYINKPCKCGSICETSVGEYDADGPVGEYKLLWDEGRDMFAEVQQ